MTAERESQRSVNQSVGVKQEGFNDATGEYPKKDYFFGTSINAAARGAKVNELYTGGGYLDVSINLPDQRASEYPHNQVQETSSGHVIEIDDTPGGERILIKHKTGSGIELRADGSTVYSSRKKKVEVVGADQTVIVEGEGKLVYKGNLDLHVTGDYNLTVGGNMNVKVHNKEVHEVYGNAFSTVYGNEQKDVHKSQSTRILQDKTTTVLGNDLNRVKGNYEDYVGGKIDFSSNDRMLMTSGGSIAISSADAFNATGAKRASVIAPKGVLGGEGFKMYAATYSGPPEGTGATTVFYGDLVGTAANALVAARAETATTAVTAGTAADDAGTAYATALGPATIAAGVITSAYTVTDAPVDNDGVSPNLVITTAHIFGADYGARNIQIDPTGALKDRITFTDDYGTVFDHEPTIHEIRAQLRNGNSNVIADGLIRKKLLGENYASVATDGEPVRSAGRAPSSRFGYTSIGNNAIVNNSKRFTPSERR
jgi:hypothetical protein